MTISGAHALDTCSQCQSIYTRLLHHSGSMFTNRARGRRDAGLVRLLDLTAASIQPTNCSKQHNGGSDM
jgi:hypothetical protein